MKRLNKNIGKFLHKVTAQDFTTVSDGAGGLTQTYSDTHTFFAEIEPLEGREAIEAEQLLGKQGFNFTTRYISELSNLSNESRLKFGTRFFNIHSVVNLDEQNEFLQIVAWEE